MITSVLTGDFIDSTQWQRGALSAAFHILEDTCNAANDWPDTTILFARRGGDAWQVAMRGPFSDLRLACFIAARLYSEEDFYHTRIAAACGHDPFPIHGDLNAATDTVFVSSGRTLEGIGPRDASWVHAEGGARHAAFVLASALADDWTMAMAQPIALLLSPGSGPRWKTARKLKKTRQAIDKALHAGGYPELMIAIEALEADDA